MSTIGVTKNPFQQFLVQNFKDLLIQVPCQKNWGKIPWEVTILSEGNPTKSEPSLKRVESPELMEWTIPLWYMFQTYRIKALIVGKYLSNGTGMLVLSLLVYLKETSLRTQFPACNRVSCQLSEDFRLKDSEAYRSCFNIYSNYYGTKPWCWIFHGYFRQNLPKDPHPRHPRCPTRSGLVSFGLAPVDPSSMDWGVQTMRHIIFWILCMYVL